jgi:hypothetical protein
LLRLKGGFLFVVSSHGSVPEVIRSRYNPVYGEDLQKLLAKANRVSQISLRNTDLGDYAIRRRNLTARALEETAPELNDFLQSFSSAKGAFKSREYSEWRYIGLAKGRVSVTGREPVSLKEMLVWLGEVGRSLRRKNVRIPEVFWRYAPVVRTPKNPLPVNILIDLLSSDDPDAIPDEDDIFVTTGAAACGERKALQWDDKCVDILNGRFKLRANGMDFDCSIAYDVNRRRYEIESTDLVEMYEPRERGGRRDPVDLVRYMNREQAFRLILEGRDEVYGRGQFFRTRLNLAGRAKKGRFDLLKILFGEAALAGMEEEKGEAKTGGAGWCSGSVFALIDESAPGTGMHEDLKKAEFLICDDLGREICDFILVQPGKKVVLIHAKAFEKAKQLSASAFHHICGQALKNTDVLIPHNTEFKPSIGKWDGAWRLDGAVVKRRIWRPIGASGSGAWSAIRRTVENPSVSKEVWLVIGNGLSVSALTQALQSGDIDSNVLQLCYLLQSTWASVLRIANGFKIFCSP